MTEKLHGTKKEFMDESLRIKQKLNETKQQDTATAEHRFNQERFTSLERGYESSKEHEGDKAANRRKLREMCDEMKRRPGYQNPDSAIAEIVAMCLLLFKVLAEDFAEWRHDVRKWREDIGARQHNPLEHAVTTPGKGTGEFTRSLQSYIKFDKEGQMDLSELEKLCQPQNTGELKALAANWLENMGYKKQPDGTFKANASDLTLTQKAFELLPSGLDDYLEQMEDADFDSSQRPRPA